MPVNQTKNEKQIHEQYARPRLLPPPSPPPAQALLASNSLQTETARVESEYEHLQEEYRALQTELKVTCCVLGRGGGGRGSHFSVGGIESTWRYKSCEGGYWTVGGITISMPLNAFTTGNPFWGQIYLNLAGRNFGALKGLSSNSHLDSAVGSYCCRASESRPKVLHCWV